jgi:hypothetical protein
MMLTMVPGDRRATRSAATACMRKNGARNGLPGFAVTPSAIQVITPFNIP